MRLPTSISILLLACATGSATAADVADANWGGCHIDRPALPVSGEAPAEGELEVLSGRAEIELGGKARFKKNIILRRGKRLLSAQDATYDFSSQTLNVEGAVEYRDEQTRVLGTRASLNRSGEEARIEGAEFQLWSAPARGSADRIEVASDGRLEMRNVTYTSCPAGKDDWLIKARRLDVDQESGYGTAHGATFRIKGVPVMYLPWFTYPVTNKRKTGFLIPNIGSSQRRGVDVTTPWYWNIAPNYDATFSPRLMTSRGLQLGGEFRYLTGNHHGELNAELLFDDDKTGENRSLFTIRHQSALPWGWRATLDAAEVSDPRYFEDFGSGIATTSQTHLPRTFDLEFFNGAWDILLRLEDYRSVDESLTRADQPYTRLPQLAIRGWAPNSVLGLSYEILGDITYFDRDTGVTGLRAHVMPTVSRPIDWRIFTLTPKFSVAHTRYSLQNTAPGMPSRPTRTAPVASLDLTTSFERFFSGSNWLMTLEPRVLYTWIPFRDQEQLPVFDTVDPDLNMVQLFRQNRFVGYDRLADTNQVALGLTSRLIDADSGVEFLRLTMGQLRFLSTQQVMLPGGSPNDSNSSDYIAEFDARLAKRWRLNAAFQWNSDQGETRRAEAGVLYRRDPRRILNFAYRFRRDSIETINFAAAWPIARRWNFVGRFNYSLDSSTPLERFAAIEYETCCWALRLNWRRFVTRRSGESDTAIGFQFILKGLSSPGTAAEDLLGYGNLGY